MSKQISRKSITFVAKIKLSNNSLFSETKWSDEISNEVEMCIASFSTVHQSEGGWLENNTALTMSIFIAYMRYVIINMVASIFWKWIAFINCKNIDFNF